MTYNLPAHIETICVFCGARPGILPAYASEARRFGKLSAQAGLNLVYGGGNIGLMGETARAAVEHGGHVTAVIPGFLQSRETGDIPSVETIVVPDMHTRKRLMSERADAFVVLPGGVGTLEEFVEQMTWVYLKRHSKPIVLMDVEGFWQPFAVLIRHMKNTGFVDYSTNYRTYFAKTADEALRALGKHPEDMPLRVEPSVAATGTVSAAAPALRAGE
jgi:uncharacterized protein (TIGR00730 family)